ncbi:PaaI family thioesterase [Ruminococcaceae bacterium OttesenSCG-928-I18]|nr:PaaI family thioesterase [Ruminococcaceae bacterium OttesenSCG-928-I18]
MKTIEEIRAHFQKDRFAAKLGIQIERAGQGEAVCSVQVTEEQKNALGRVQGGFLFTLADFTFAVAANSRQMGTVTLDSHIHYLAAPADGRLTAMAVPKSTGGRISVYEVFIRDEHGQEVALMTATGYRTRA